MTPLMARIIPVWVSPSFMLETSIATMGVLVRFDFNFTRTVPEGKSPLGASVDFSVYKYSC